MDFYYPGDKFPSLSVTGARCSLNCPHCGGKYLKDMVPVKTPDRLYEEAADLSNRGGNGFLLSGGTNSEGKVPLSGYYPVLQRIKDETDLLINVHTGIPSQEDVKRLEEADIDVVSYDIIGDDSTIEKIYGLDLTVDDYKGGYRILKKGGVKVVPHVTVGLDEGRIKGEYRALEIVASSEEIILNSLIPSEYGSSVSKGDFLSVTEYAVENTDAEIIIGCMRERGRSALEIESIELGVEGIVIPSLKTRRWAEREYDIKRIETCCAI